MTMQSILRNFESFRIETICAVQSLTTHLIDFNKKFQCLIFLLPDSETVGTFRGIVTNRSLYYYFIQKKVRTLEIAKETKCTERSKLAPTSFATTTKSARDSIAMIYEQRKTKVKVKFVLFFFKKKTKTNIDVRCAIIRRVAKKNWNIFLLLK